MRVDCIHGYFIFKEFMAGEVSDFMAYSGLKLTKVKDFYTFSKLSTLKVYSIKGVPILDIDAKVTFEGDVGEVFRKNQIVYDFTTDTLKDINQIQRQIKIKQAGNRYISNGLIQPGSVSDQGLKVTDYTAFYSFRHLTWSYSEVAGV